VIRPIICEAMLNTVFRIYIYTTDHSGRAVLGMNCLLSLESWDRGFKSPQGMDVCVCVLCIGSGLATGLPLVQGVLPSV
jgi:hypothetical protein